MTGLPWFKCDTVALDDGLIGLSLAERGAYITIINSIYRNGGPIRDSSEWLCAKLGCTAKEWSAIRRSLLRKGKLHTLNINAIDHLSNSRCEAEIVAYNALLAKRHRASMAALRVRGKHLKVVDISPHGDHEDST